MAGQGFFQENIRLSPSDREEAAADGRFTALKIRRIFRMLPTYMELSREAISDFKKVFLKETGRQISDSEAQRMATELFRLFLSAYEPVPQKWLEEFAGKPKDSI